MGFATSVVRRIAVFFVCMGIALPQAAFGADKIWDIAGGTAWFSAGNWSENTVPLANDVAQFGALPTASNVASGIGINMSSGSTNNGPANQAIGAIQITNARTVNLFIGNSNNTTFPGTLTFNGALINSLANTILYHNGGTAAAPTVLTIQNSTVTGNQTLAVALAATTNIIQIATGNGATGANFGNTIAITSNIVEVNSGSSISLLGGGNSTNRGGTLTLGGTNSFTGGMTLGASDGSNAGRVRVSTVASLPTTGNITVYENSQLQLDATTGTYGDVGQTLTLASLGAVQGSSTNIAEGGLRFNPGNGTNSVTFAPSTTLSGAAGIHVENGNGVNTLTMSGPIGGGGSLTKTGAGQLVLSNAANTYNGPTNVNAGTLVVNGSIANSAVTVNAGGTLKGTGTTGAITVNNGGGLSPGNSVGQLSTGGSNLVLNSGAELFFEFNDATGTAGQDWDLIDLEGGDLIVNAHNLDPQARVKVYVGSWLANNSVPGAADNFNFAPGTEGNIQEYQWLFIAADELIIDNPEPGSLAGRFELIDNGVNGVFNDSIVGAGNPFTRPTSSLGQGTFTMRELGGNLYIHYSAIPEPGSMALAGLASIAAGWYGKRRLKKNGEVAVAN